MMLQVPTAYHQPLLQVHAPKPASHGSVQKMAATAVDSSSNVATEELIRDLMSPAEISSNAAASITAPETHALLLPAPAAELGPATSDMQLRVLGQGGFGVVFVPQSPYACPC